ncbi:MAG: hypothetical protein LPK12_01885 [Rhodobacterales bacterium]|nr:hypothetical protein [Rhodobacterales bacterium]MDX5498693.1 hypothetical protein [Rhodobacterales bacterium]
MIKTLRKAWSDLWDNKEYAGRIGLYHRRAAVPAPGGQAVRIGRYRR